MSKKLKPQLSILSKAKGLGFRGGGFRIFGV